MKGGRYDRGGGVESERDERSTMDDKVVSTVNAIIYWNLCVNISCVILFVSYSH